MYLKKKVLRVIMFSLMLFTIAYAPLGVSANSTKAVDGRTYTRIYNGTVRTSGETTELLRFRIRFTEYVDSTGSYISSIDHVYIDEGDWPSGETFTMQSSYPKYSGIGEKNVTISCKGILAYKYSSIPYQFDVNFKINVSAKDGYRV